MKKLLSTLLVALMVLGALTACAPTAPAPATSESPAAEAPAQSEAPAAELKELPTLDYLYNTNSGHQVIAEALQGIWKDELGLEITVESQEWAVFQTNRTEGNYQIARHGWLGDYVDPMTFLDMWVSNSGQNDARYKNPEYDKLIETAKKSADQAERMAAMHEAERIIMNDLPIIPLYHYTNVWLDNGKVKDYVHDVLIGHMIFTWASKDDGTPIVYHLGATPKSLDPQLNNATDGADVIQHTFEGLTTKDKNGVIVPGMAESWDTSEDGLTWTFKLRDAKWSDGKPVTAQDFVTGWTRAVDPATECEYAYQLWYVKNGEAITNGEASPDTLGVKALDEKTLEVTLEAPCGYFTQMTAFPTLYPVRADVVKNEAWANKPETYISNGPYVLKKFELQNEIIIEKNPNYWNAANVACPTVIMKLTDDDAAALSAFESGEMDIAESFPPEETQRMKDAGYFNVKPILGTYFIVINLEGDSDFLKDPNIRKALALAVDRDYIIEVAQNEAVPAFEFVPAGVPDADGTDFIAKNGGPLFGTGDYATDLATAKQILRDAGYNVKE